MKLNNNHTNQQPVSQHTQQPASIIRVSLFRHNAS